jgi:hypothetical protein
VILFVGLGVGGVCIAYMELKIVLTADFTLHVLQSSLNFIYFFFMIYWIEVWVWRSHQKLLCASKERQFMEKRFAIYFCYTDVSLMGTTRWRYYKLLLVRKTSIFLCSSCRNWRPTWYSRICVHPEDKITYLFAVIKYLQTGAASYAYSVYDRRKDPLVMAAKSNRCCWPGNRSRFLLVYVSTWNFQSQETLFLCNDYQGKSLIYMYM